MFSRLLKSIYILIFVVLCQAILSCVIYAEDFDKQYIELENVEFSASGASVATGSDGSINYAVFSSETKGASASFTFSVQNAGVYDMNIVIRSASENGSYEIYLDGEKIYKDFYMGQSSYTNRIWYKIELAQHNLSVGEHSIEIVSKSSKTSVLELDSFSASKSENITEYIVDEYNGGNFTENFLSDDINAQYREYYNEPFPSLIINLSSSGKKIEYTAEIKKAGYYSLNFISKFGTNNDAFDIYADGKLLQRVDLTSRSGWHSVNIAEVYLTEGKHTVSFVSAGKTGKNRMILSVVKLIYSASVSRNVSEENAVMTSIYVSPDGNDMNSGTSDNPLKTIEKAIEKAKDCCENMTGNIEIVLKGGTYNPSYSIKDIPLYDHDYKKDESGNIISAEKKVRGSYEAKISNIKIDNDLMPTNGYKIIIKAYSGETPIISGAKEIKGWTIYDAEKNIYVADAKGIDTRQLYVNGVRATRARSKFSIEYSSDYFSTYSVTDEGYSISATDMLTWKNIKDVEFVYLRPDCYYSPRVPVESVEEDRANGVTVKMQNPAWKYLNELRMKDGHYPPAFIENAFELLDSEGEWYLDKNEEKIYYKPLEGEDIFSSKIEAGILEELFSIEGKSAAEAVGNIEFCGITFTGTTYLRPNTANGHIDAQSNMITEEYTTDYNFEIPHAAVNVKNAYGIKFKNCSFTALGSNGINFYHGTSDVEIEGNKFSDVSGTALVIGGVDSTYRFVNERDKVLRNFLVKNNVFTDIATEYFAAVAISAGHPSNVTIANNEIANLSYTGIHIGWGIYTDDEENCAFGYGMLRDINVLDNTIYNTNILLRDGAPIYVRGKVGTSEIKPNLIKGNYISKRATMGYGGVYFDCGLGCWSAEENLLTDVDTGFFGQSLRESFIGKNNFVNYRIRPVGAEGAEAGDRVIKINSPSDKGAKYIAAKAGLQNEYKQLGNYPAGELFSIVPSETMYNLNTTDTLNTELIATDIMGNEIDISDYDLSFYKGTYLNKRNFELYKLKNEGILSLQSNSNYTLNEDKSITFWHPQHMAFWIKAQIGSQAPQYAYVMAEAGNAVSVSNLKVTVDENSTVSRNLTFPDFDYPNFGSVGSYIEYELDFTESGFYRLSLGKLTNEHSSWCNNRCIVSVSVDGEIINEEIDLYKENFSSVYLGEILVEKPCVKKLRFTCLGKNNLADYKGMRMAIECIYVDKRGAYSEITLTGRNVANSAMGVIADVTDLYGNSVYSDYVKCDGEGNFSFVFSTKENVQQTYLYTLYFTGDNTESYGEFTLCPQSSYDGSVLSAYEIKTNTEEAVNSVFDGAFSAEVKIKDLSCDAEFIIAQYDKDGKIINASLGNFSFAEDSGYTTIKSNSFLPAENAYKINVFLWEKGGSLTPVIKDYIYDLSNPISIVVNYRT